MNHNDTDNSKLGGQPDITVDTTNGIAAANARLHRKTVVSYKTDSEAKQLVDLLTDRFPNQELRISSTQHSATIDVEVWEGATSSEVAHFLANKGFSVEVVAEWWVEVNPEHFTVVAEWLIPPEWQLPAEWQLPKDWRQLDLDGVWLRISQEQSSKRLRVTLHLADGLEAFNCTYLNIGQKALQIWENTGRPILTRDREPAGWPLPEDDANWHAANPNIIASVIAEKERWAEAAKTNDTGEGEEDLPLHP